MSKAIKTKDKRTVQVCQEHKCLQVGMNKITPLVLNINKYFLKYHPGQVRETRERFKGTPDRKPGPTKTHSSVRKVPGRCDEKGDRRDHQRGSITRRSGCP